MSTEANGSWLCALAVTYEGIVAFALQWTLMGPAMDCASSWIFAKPGKADHTGTVHKCAV